MELIIIILSKKNKEEERQTDRRGETQRQTVHEILENTSADFSTEE